MKIDFYKVVIIILLSVIAYAQISNIDINRYEKVDGEIFVFDTKTGNLYSPEIGVYKLIQESIEFEELRNKKEEK